MNADTTAFEVEAVLFDMDGTLVDSTRVVEGVWAEFAARHGVALGELLAFSHGRRTEDTVARFLPAGRDVAAVAAALQRSELERLDGIAAIPGAGELLRALRGARVAVVTSAPRTLALHRLAAANLVAPDLLVAAEDVTAGKPDPEGYRAAAEALGVSIERCLVFEDAEAGIRAGIASGARTVVVGGHRSETTAALHRVVDFSAIAAAVSADGATVALHW